MPSAFVIGRHASCDLVVANPRVSAVHALMARLAGGEVLVADRGSANGTSCDGRPVTHAQTTPGTTLAVAGSTVSWAEMARHLDAPGPSRLVRLVGRHPACDVVLDDDRVSAVHAAAVPTSAGWHLVDLGSNNGLFVDEVRVSVAHVRPGQRVRFGSLQVDVLRRLQLASTRPPSGTVPRRHVVRPAGVPGVAARPLALVAALVALLGVGAVAVSWFMGRPHDGAWQPWRHVSAPSPPATTEVPKPPDPVEVMRTALRAHPDLASALQDQAQAARELADAMAGAEASRPLLQEIDRWRAQRLDATVTGMLALGALLVGTSAPDNVYDAVVAAIDLAQPGAGLALQEIERLVREVLEFRQTVTGLAAAGDAASRAVATFERAPGPDTLAACARAIDVLSRTEQQSTSRLDAWRQRSGDVSRAAILVRSALRHAATTPVGRMAAGPLGSLDGLIGESMRPLDAFDERVGAVLAASARSRAGLAAVARAEQAGRRR